MNDAQLKKIICRGFIFIFLGCFFSSAQGAGELRVSLAVYQDGRYVKPPLRKIKIVKQPTPFQVILTNESSSSQAVYEQAMSGGFSSISLEITDEKGQKNTIRRKKMPLSSEAVTHQYLSPGKSRIFEITLNEDDWVGAYKLQKTGSREFKVRAVYDNDGKAISSAVYEVFLVIE